MDKVSAFGKNLRSSSPLSETRGVPSSTEYKLTASLTVLPLLPSLPEPSSMSRNSSAKLMRRYDRRPHQSLHLVNIFLMNSTLIPISADTIACGLHRTRETSRCIEAGPSETAPSHVRSPAFSSSNTRTYPPRSQYSNEAYDYPPNIRESFNDLGRTISEKVTLLSHASSPSEAQAAFTAPPSAKPQPKTFNHAIARASLAGSQLITQQHPSTSEDPLAAALEKYALAEEKVGEARLAQDAQIQSRFLAGWSTTLNTNIKFATRARANVENARLMLDSTKARAKGGAKGMNPDIDSLNEEARAEIEAAEDEFVGQTEEAVGVMKNVVV
jgi:hypothetical protein